MTRFEPLDPARCGCGAIPAEPLVSVDRALDIGRALALPLEGAEPLAARAARGRIAARPVWAETPVPPFAAAAMDGVALRLDDLAGAGPWALPLAFTIRAGEAAAPLPPGHACRIMTGAPVPPGAEAVVAQEEVRLERGRAVLSRRPAAGENIRRAGSDLPRGAMVLAAGALIGAREAGALAAAGIAELAVRRRLRVALITTGSELRAPGAPLRPGEIWNANRELLAAELALPWIDLLDLGPVPDEPVALALALRHAADVADLVVTTGAVSVGEADHLPGAVLAAGGTIAVAGVAMKPGKPLSLGRVGAAVWVGLPGDPVAAFVCWRVVGRVLAAARAGLATQAPPRELARLARGLVQRPGRCGFRLARFDGHDAGGAPRVACLAGDGSHRAGLLAEAEALVLVPGEVEALRAGDLVELIRL